MRASTPGAVIRAQSRSSHPGTSTVQGTNGSRRHPNGTTATTAAHQAPRRRIVGVVTRAACENCGFPDVELVLVRRVYVVPASWDQEGSETVMPEPGAVVRLVLLAVPERARRR